MKATRTKLYKKYGAVTCATLSLLAFSGNAQSQVIQNGGFDTASSLGSEYETEIGKAFYRDITSITGWTTTRAGLADNILGYSSGKAAVLVGSKTSLSSSFKQTINFASPGMYHLNFDSFTKPFVFEGVSTYLVTLRPTFLSTEIPINLSLTENSVDNSITNHSHLFKVNIVGSYELTFANRSEAGSTAIYQDVLIDNVGITLAPEPSSTALLGLGTLAFLCRRKRNRS